jgi:Ca-activated chloride channel homolog
MPPKIRPHSVIRRLFLLVFLLGFGCFSNLLPEDSQQSETTKDQRNRTTRPDLATKSPKEDTKGFTIGVNVDLVMMHTSVYDKNGRFVSGLKQDNFKVYEDGIEQKILSFSQEDVPLSMGLLIDLSGSMRSKIDKVNSAALAFIRASNPEDQVFLVGFNEEVELLQEYTNDIDEISDSLENTIVSGGTALYDAVYLGVQKAHAGTKPKKAIVVITDGEDRDSYYTLDEMVAKVQESDVQVFAVGFLGTVPDKGIFGRLSKSAPEKARDALQRICDETGGKAFFPKDLSEMGGIVAEIAHELRNQYSIGFISSNSARDGSWRRMKIELSAKDTADLHVRCRRGYYAPKSSAQ